MRQIEVLFSASLACPICGHRLEFKNGVLIQPRHKRGDSPLELLQPSGRCDRCGEHVEALVDVERHVAGCANGPLFILRARGTIPEASSGGFVRLSILEGEESVYAVEDWRAEEVTTSASGGDEDED